jgi:hypothetical protein
LFYLDGDQISVISPSVSVDVLESQFSIQFEDRLRSQNSESVENCRKVLFGQQVLDDVGAVQTVDAVRSKDSALKKVRTQIVIRNCSKSPNLTI